MGLCRCLRTSLTNVSCSATLCFDRKRFQIIETPTRLKISYDQSSMYTCTHTYQNANCIRLRQLLHSMTSTHTHKCIRTSSCTHTHTHTHIQMHSTFTIEHMHTHSLTRTRITLSQLNTCIHVHFCTADYARTHSHHYPAYHRLVRSPELEHCRVPFTRRW